MSISTSQYKCDFDDFCKLHMESLKLHIKNIKPLINSKSFYFNFDKFVFSEELGSSINTGLIPSHALPGTNTIYWKDLPQRSDLQQ